MPREVVATPGLASSPGFSHVVRAGDLVVVSGQIARQADGQVVGRGDPARQAAQVFDNLETALTAAGVGLDDVIRLGIFITDPSHRAAVSAQRDRVFSEPRPASTLLVVAALADPDLLVEVEALAHARHEDPTLPPRS